jgi:uncharacterized protein involved in cysteine biosynthesis
VDFNHDRWMYWELCLKLVIPIQHLKAGTSLTSMGSPVTDFWRGFRTFPRGLRWLGKHKSFVALLSVPFVLGLIMLGVGWGYFLSYQEAIFSFILFEQPTVWYGLVFYYICKAILMVSLLVLFMVAALLVTTVVASPIYEWVSVAVERDVTGSSKEISLWQALRLIPEELKRVAFILLVSLAVILIPGLNLLSLLVTAFLLGWDAYDIPLARRGWSFGERLRFVMSDFWAVLGFGLWLVVPFVQFFLVPLAISGGTLLSIEHLQRKRSESLL